MHDHEVSTRRILRQQRCNTSLTQCTHRWSLVTIECYAGSSTPTLGIHSCNGNIKAKIMTTLQSLIIDLAHDKLESTYCMVSKR
jgi:hypothetical protein